MLGIAITAKGGLFDRGLTYRLICWAAALWWLRRHGVSVATTGLSKAIWMISTACQLFGALSLLRIGQSLFYYRRATLLFRAIAIIRCGGIVCGRLVSAMISKPCWMLPKPPMTDIGRR